MMTMMTLHHVRYSKKVPKWQMIENIAALTTMSDPWLAWERVRSNVLPAECSLGLTAPPAWAVPDSGAGGAATIGPRATTSSTCPLAFCKIRIACWCEMFASRAWLSMVRIWSFSWSRPSLQQDKKVKLKRKDLFLYSAVPNPLDRSNFKALYTSPPGRPAHSDTYSTSLGSILAKQQLCAKNIHSHFHRRLQPGNHLYSWVNWGVVERTKMPKLRNGSKGRIRTRALSIASPAFYHWATALHNTIRWHHCTL